MKKSIGLSVSMLAISLMLVGCSNSDEDQAKDSSNKDAKSEKIASSKKAASESKAKESSKKKSESESKAKQASEVQVQSASSQASNETVASSQQAQQQAQSSNQQTQAVDFSLSLTDFVNRYGMSPAAYRMKKMGMSQQQALEATPDSQESSGEIQLEHLPQ